MINHAEKHSRVIFADINCWYTTSI